MSEAIIRAEGLSKHFGDFVAVDGIRLSVEPGSIFAFLGANGSGKSTTIRMLIGLLTPTAGTIVVDGVDVIREPRRVRDRVGYMGQRVSLYRGLSLRENIEFYAGLYSLSDAVLERRWGQLRERFGLAAAEGEHPEDLPAGVRQRAGLALSILHSPRLLFLDEPTAGVDVLSRGLFWDLIREEAASGVTVFVTTHFLEEADYCDWISFIDQGRIIADASPETLRARYSDGYRFVIDASPGERPRLSAALAGAGLPAEECAEGLALRSRSFDEDLAERLTRALGAPAAGRVHVEPAPMSAVFERLLREGGAGAQERPR